MNSAAAYSAVQFCRAAIKAGHQISQVFFHQAGVSQSNYLITPMADEFDVVSSWQKITAQYEVPLRVCVSASEKRGIMGEAQSVEHDKPRFNLADGFEIAGLGVLHDAVLKSDRMITFN